MKPFTTLLLCLCIVLASCTGTGYVEEKEDDDDEGNKGATVTAEKAEKAPSVYLLNSDSIRRLAAKAEVVQALIPGPFSFDSLKLKLFVLNGEPLMLQHELYSDAGEAVGVDTFFFARGKPAFWYHIKKTKDGREFGEIVEDSFRTYIPNERDEHLLYMYANDLWVLTSYMAYFSQYAHSYQYVPASPKASPVLRAFDSVKLYEKPDIHSKVLDTFPRNTFFRFIASTRELDTINGCPWVWYRVATPDDRQGWIFGDPDQVYELNDEWY